MYKSISNIYCCSKKLLNVYINAFTLYIFCNCLFSFNIIFEIYTLMRFVHFNCWKVFHWVNMSNLFIYFFFFYYSSISLLKAHFILPSFSYKQCCNKLCTCLLVYTCENLSVINSKVNFQGLMDVSFQLHNILPSASPKQFISIYTSISQFLFCYNPQMCLNLLFQRPCVLPSSKNKPAAL